MRNYRILDHKFVLHDVYSNEELVEMTYVRTAPGYSTCQRKKCIYYKEDDNLKLLGVMVTGILGGITSSKVWFELMGNDYEIYDGNNKKKDNFNLGDWGYYKHMYVDGFKVVVEFVYHHAYYGRRERKWIVDKIR